MSDWDAGYTAEIEYTHGYFAELNPLRIQFAFAYNGLACPEVGTACELGFGQGMSVNLHAAASITKWWGTDFNPAQAAFAQEMGKASGSDVQLFDEAFADFANRADLPDFDYICLHGIFSWISAENRQVIVDFVRRKLKVGGVVYISYNTMPGWTSFAPMRELMSLHAKVQGSSGEGVLSRADQALGFADRMLKTNPKFARAVPAVNGWLEALKKQNRSYLAHEYFNQHWVPMYFSEMAQWMDSAKLQFACSANFVELVPHVNFTAEQQSFLNEIHDPVLAQTARDFMGNQSFRKDYWVKGARKLSAFDRQAALRQQRIMLTVPRAEARIHFVGGLGESSLKDDVAQLLLDQLVDYRIKSLSELEQVLSGDGLNLDQIAQAVVLLLHIGQVALVQNSAVITTCKKQTDQINAYVMRKARSGNELTVLVSPVLGGACSVGRFEQLFLLARAEGSSHPKEWAQYVWEILQQQGQLLVKDGKTLQSAEGNLAELVNQATEFAEKRLPLIQVLQLA